MILSSRSRVVPAAVLLLLLMPFAAGNAGAQYFGRNKVQYDREDIRVLGTEHFDIYYSSEDVAAAQIAGRLAERWYARLSEVFDHRLRGRQPIVLYGSHRRFEQTNVYQGLIDESTGGFTDSRRRRVVLPFSGSIADTDHVLGHEIVHAFQFDLADQHRSTLAVPLWFVEGMAEFLTLGAFDAQTAMWMRDAVAAERLPSIAELASARYFPYRWGAALWSHLVDEYGEDLPARAFREKRDVRRRLQQLTGRSLDELTTGWHEALRARYATERDDEQPRLPEPILSRRSGGGRLNLAASLSPDGRRIVFLSERDQFSIDLFLADAETGRTIRKLITTAASADLESLQYLHSAGAWNRAGTHFAIATVRRGRPMLLLLDIDGKAPPHELPLPQMDEVFSPTWSAGDRLIAFSALRGGVTDLYVIERATGTVRQLTRDAYSDLQPAWSPDGQTIAFATDRFTTRIDRLAFGAFQIGLLDVATGAVTPAPALEGANHLDPAWAPGGASLYFVADPDGVRNVYRMVHPGGAVYRITGVDTGVSGVTRSSPVLSVSSNTGALAFSVFRRSGYDVHRLTSTEDLHGLRVEGLAVSNDAPQGADETGAIEPVSPLPSIAAVRAQEEPYRSTLSLEAIGSPYFSAGGGPYGGYVSGGASLLFGDLLGNQQLMTTAYISSRLDESAFGALYVNRTHRWNWGVTMEQTPELRLRTNSVHIDPEKETVLTRERERSIWTHRSLGGFAAYPLNRSRRVELSAGIRQIGFSLERRTEVVSRLSGMIVDHETQPLPSGPAIAMAETGVALIGDTAIFGGTAPILGTRYRMQAGSAFGGLQYVSVLADYRRYLMPIRPFTVAVRAVHAGRYGQDADDIRLRDVYLGSPTLVRGYDAPAVARSECGGSGVECAALNTLLASRFAALKVELRIPVWSAINSSSRVRYGPIPMDAFVFADAGAGWGGEQRFGPGGRDGRWVRSAGAGVRVNAMGMIVELAAVRPLDLQRAGWSFSLNLRPGF